MTKGAHDTLMCAPLLYINRCKRLGLVLCFYGFLLDVLAHGEVSDRSGHKDGRECTEDDTEDHREGEGTDEEY